MYSNGKVYSHVINIHNYKSFFLCFSVSKAGVPVKDVVLPDNPAKKMVLLSKHADYIEAFEKDKDDYVCVQ